mmetsp:Transcript_99394/g.281507  ORF Transcript_99394/g.281507 Transcript_99394/m.281507 type:complete len:327 (+) Transcript_99394:853-1833(+)
MHHVLHVFHSVWIRWLGPVVNHAMRLEVLDVSFPLRTALRQKLLQRVGLLLLAGLQRVHQRGLLGETGEALVDRHMHRQEVGRVRDVRWPLVRLAPGKLLMDLPPVVRVVDKPVHDLHGGREARPGAEAAEVPRLHVHAVAAHGPHGVPVAPQPHKLLQPQKLVDLETRDRADCLEDYLDVQLLHFLRVRTVMRKTLDLVHHNLHEPIVGGEEIYVRDAEDGLLRDLGEGPVLVCLDRVRIPHVEANKIVHHLETVQHNGARDGELRLPNHPRNHFHAAEVPLAADDVDLFAVVLADSSDVLDRESAVAVDNAALFRALEVVDLIK